MGFSSSATSRNSSPRNVWTGQFVKKPRIQFSLQSCLALITGFVVGMAVSMFPVKWTEHSLKTQWSERYIQGYDAGYEMRELDEHIKKRNPNWIPPKPRWNKP